MTDLPGDLTDADRRLLASLVSGNLLVVRQPVDLAPAADVSLQRAQDRLGTLDDAGLVAEVSDGRFTITDEGFEVIVEEFDGNVLGG